MLSQPLPIGESEVLGAGVGVKAEGVEGLLYPTFAYHRAKVGRELLPLTLEARLNEGEEPLFAKIGEELFRNV